MIPRQRSIGPFCQERGEGLTKVQKEFGREGENLKELDSNILEHVVVCKDGQEEILRKQRSKLDEVEEERLFDYATSI